MLLWTHLCCRLSGPVSAPRRRHLRAPNSRYLCNVKPWLRQGLGCPRADPPVHHRTFSHVLRHNFLSEAAHCTPSHRLRLAEPPHALSRATRGLRKTPLPPGAVRCRRHGRGFHRATCGPLLRVAGNASSLESLHRRSVPQTAICTSRQALLHSASRDRALVCSGSSCFRFGLRAAVPPKLCLRVRTTLVPAAVPVAYGCVPRGQWAPLDADMFEFIDRSSCLVEPVVVGRASRLLPVLAQTCTTQHVQRRVRSLLANVPIAMP